MKTPFRNDPFPFIYRAFCVLYGVKCDEIWWEPNMDNGVGYTDFNDDGTVIVRVSAEIPVSAAAEILCHELAHVAVGIEHEHDKVWEEAFEKIMRTAEEHMEVCLSGESDEG